MALEDAWQADPVEAVEDAFGLLQWLLDGRTGAHAPAPAAATPAAVALGQMVIGWMQAFARQAGAVTEEEIAAHISGQLGDHRASAILAALTEGMEAR